MNNIIYTTGEVRDLTGLSDNKVRTYCNKGLLKYFVIPLSTHRRIMREDLISFLKTHKIPIPDELSINLGDKVLITSHPTLLYQTGVVTNLTKHTVQLQLSKQNTTQYTLPIHHVKPYA